jgi:hypothetical protein
MFYYAADKALFSSKLPAVTHSKNTNNQLWYYYHDDVYKCVDWKTEPAESLNYYYIEQALRLREKYEYLILFYSGGYDSTNILETFHYNNIKIDKIVIVGATSQDTYSGDDTNRNGELYANAYPYINKLGLSSITETIDYSTYFNDINNFSISSYADSWPEFTGSWFSPHHWFWHDVEKFVIPKTIMSKKVGLIFGRDKPSLTTHNTFSFTDTVLSAYGNIDSTENADRINFYWDPGNSNILVKQLHVIKRFKDAVAHSSMGLQQNQIFGKHDTNSIIYNLRQPLIYKSPKSRSTLFSGRDSFLLNKQGSDVHKFYAAGMNHTLGANKELMMRPIYTREYSIV